MKIRPGNGISRQYNNAKIIRNRGWLVGGSSFVLAGLNASQRNGFFTVALGIITCVWAKIIETSIYRMQGLKNEYKQILERANSIKNQKKS